MCLSLSYILFIKFVNVGVYIYIYQELPFISHFSYDCFVFKQWVEFYIRVANLPQTNLPNKPEWDIEKNDSYEPLTAQTILIAKTHFLIVM